MPKIFLLTPRLHILWKLFNCIFNNMVVPNFWELLWWISGERNLVLRTDIVEGVTKVYRAANDRLTSSTFHLTRAQSAAQVGTLVDQFWVISSRRFYQISPNLTNCFGSYMVYCSWCMYDPGAWSCERRFRQYNVPYAILQWNPVTVGRGWWLYSTISRCWEKPVNQIK